MVEQKPSKLFGGQRIQRHKQGYPSNIGAENEPCWNASLLPPGVDLRPKLGFGAAVSVNTIGQPRVINGIPRFCEGDNYTNSFGFQWNRFTETQVAQAREIADFSERRLFAATGWSPEHLDGLDILEVGSGAGRFSRPILQRTSANLYSVDYSSAVEANLKNNGAIAPDRFHLFQASIYELPFPDDSFDKTFCLGVLQHTPDFEASVRALVAKTKPGGEIVVDFYSVRGWWTKLHAKYLLRPFTRRMDNARLLRLIDRHVDRLIAAYSLFEKVRLRPLTRFLPLVDIGRTFPAGLSPSQVREWAVLDTFDMFSPEFDQPQRIEAVAAMFERAGADVTFAGQTEVGAVVRGVKR
jgi:SAM-dependent methyltransferase